MSELLLSALARIECARGDLTLECVDAIVNAASAELRGGGGVDGAIHRAAGPELLRELVRLHPDGCPTGEVRLSGGHRLAARYVFHAVGPIWRGGGMREAEQLASCYARAIALAAELGLATIAFPAISTGAYGYPAAPAARVALEALGRALASAPGIARARIVLARDELLAVFEGELARQRALAAASGPREVLP